MKPQSLSVFVPRVMDRVESFSPGHRACQGCVEALALRLVLKAAGHNTIVTSATGCMEVISSPFPHTAWRVPWIHIAFENSAAVGSGVESAWKILMEKGRRPRRRINYLIFAGDGGTADIGLQSLSGALERGHDILYVCLDNEAYMNTGIQRSSSTPYGAGTTTSPPGRKSLGQATWKKDMPAIAAAHKIPYVATASPSYPADLTGKVKRALSLPGPAYLHILCVCPTGWRSDPEMGIRLGRLAVLTGAFPLYEVIHGRTVLNVDPGELRPMKEYMRLQGRFRHLTDADIQRIQLRVRAEFQSLRQKAAL